MDLELKIEQKKALAQMWRINNVRFDMFFSGSFQQKNCLNMFVDKRYNSYNIKAFFFLKPTFTLTFDDVCFSFVVERISFGNGICSKGVSNKLFFPANLNYIAYSLFCWLRAINECHSISKRCHVWLFIHELHMYIVYM